MKHGRRRFALIRPLQGPWAHSQFLVEYLECGKVVLTDNATEIDKRLKEARELATGYSINGMCLRELCSSDGFKTLFPTCQKGHTSKDDATVKQELRNLCGELPDAVGESSVPKSHDTEMPLTLKLDEFQRFDAAQVTVHPIEPIDTDYKRYGGRAFKLRNVLTPEECRTLIEHMSKQMEPVRYRKDYRRNDRCVFDSPELAELLWSRVASFVKDLVLHVPTDPAKQHLDGEEPEECPAELQVGLGREGTWEAIGLNECLRFCRYNAGGFFRKHCDHPFVRSSEEQSLFTCMFYLDGGLEGGATRFLKIEDDLSLDGHLKRADQNDVLASVPPEPGLCLLFFQPGLLHEGEDLVSGTKHILRTDVMFRRKPGSEPERSGTQRFAMALLRQAQAYEEAGLCDRAVELYRRALKMDPDLNRVI